MFEKIKNATVFADKYHAHPEAIIISTYFNPQESPYRLKAFNYFYNSIKHLNHAIIECVIGDAKPQLEDSQVYSRVYTPNLLWHKEALLNALIKQLPAKYKYIFWVDADVIFMNNDWLTEGVEQLKKHKIIQPFEYCVHLEREETRPSWDTIDIRYSKTPNKINKKAWRSFCANYVDTLGFEGYPAVKKEWDEADYDTHGHVGFAWAARRDVLEAVPLYDKALIGGADHIIAHAAAGQLAHKCITKSFTDNIDEVHEWSEDFYSVVGGDIGFVGGELYHIWHGDIDKRQYLKRIQDFTAKTKQITHKDKNGLYITDEADDAYMKRYFREREVSPDDGFLASMAVGYMTDSTLLGTMYGGNMLGAMAGDLLRDDTPTPLEPSVQYGGGEFGGGGAGGSWGDNNPTPVDNTITDAAAVVVASENFS